MSDNDNQIEIVQFADSKYGLRRLRKLAKDYEFKDLRADKEYWWTKDTQYFINDCRGQKDVVMQKYILLTDNGNPVTFNEDLEIVPVKKKGWSDKLIRMLF